MASLWVSELVGRRLCSWKVLLLLWLLLLELGRREMRLLVLMLLLRRLSGRETGLLLLLLLLLELLLLELLVLLGQLLLFSQGALLSELVLAQLRRVLLLGAHLADGRLAVDLDWRRLVVETGLLLLGQSCRHQRLLGLGPGLLARSGGGSGCGILLAGRGRVRLDHKSGLTCSVLDDALLAVGVHVAVGALDSSIVESGLLAEALASRPTSCVVAELVVSLQRRSDFNVVQLSLLLGGGRLVGAR